MDFVHREMTETLRTSAGEFPVVVLTGPRQTGKTTLLRHLFPGHPYVTLDDPGLRQLALTDPGLFLEGFPTGAIVDEIQYAPGLLPHLKMWVDTNRTPGAWVLTGSQAFPLMEGISESLAGRAAIHELLPFSSGEIGGETANARKLWDRIFQGYYPAVATKRSGAAVFHASYTATFLERDVRQLGGVGDLRVFQHFLELMAARAGSLLNLSSLARDLGISQPQVKRYLSALEASRLVYLLRPYFANVGKRVVKSPKVYFTDTGLLAWLLRYPTAETLQAGPMAGAFFENMVVVELLKRSFNKPSRAGLYFFRDSNGNEADLVVASAGGLHLAEIKMAKGVEPRTAQTLEKLGVTLKAKTAVVAHLTDKPMPLSRAVKSVPWWDLLNLI